MKRYLIIILLLLSISGYSYPSVSADTISYWKVYNGGELIMEGNVLKSNTKIILPKGKIKAIDSLMIRYFDDTPCIDCNGSITIKTDANKEIRVINNDKGNYLYYIRTVELQVLSFNSRSTILKFYYQEDEADKELLLFEIEIK